MNNTSLFIANIYHYSLMVRDTLEYTMNKPSFSKEVYNQRKAALKAGILPGTPLGNFLKQNEKIGPEITEKINNFVNDVYGDDSTVVQLTQEGEIRVDHTQHLIIYDFVIGIHETITDILYGYINFVKSKNELEPQIEKLVKTDEAFYRGFVFLQVIVDLQKYFLEFNQAMQEMQGKPSPQSNYIVKDIQKLVGFLSFVKAHSHLSDKEICNMFDESFHLVEMTQGKRDLPEGKKFPDVFKDTIELVKKFTGAAEIIWRQVYEPIIKELIEVAKKSQEAAKEKAAPADKLPEA